MPKSRLNSLYRSPNESPGFLLWKVSNEWQRCMRLALKDLDLTHVQFVLLASVVWLEDQGTEVTQAILSKHASIDKMMVSEVIRTLEKKDLVIRKSNPNDQRGFLVSSTSTGIKRIQEAMRSVEGANQRFFSYSAWPINKALRFFRSLLQQEVP